MFCKFCGNQIPDGEVCFCEQAVAQRAAANQQQAAPSASPVAAPAAPAAGSVDVGAILSKVLGSFTALFKNTNYIGADMTTPIAFSITGLVLHMLSWLCLKSMLLGDLLESLPVKIKGITGTFVWCGCLSYLIPLACFVLIPLVGSLIRKEGVNIRKAFACAAAVSVIPSVLFLLAGVVGLVVDKVGFVLLLVAILSGIINCAKLAGKQVRGNSVWSTVLVALIVAAMVGLTAYIEYSVLKDFIASAISNIMSGILGNLGGLGGLGGLFG